ncbi:MAG: peptide chain release factor N(5)-glutamine methyltransferase [Deltaproteobacteria bacterium]|nr:peptide chain release factor N(5)-glutamine methyltransferase [Deltaproteobacteria bacterium]
MKKSWTLLEVLQWTGDYFGKQGLQNSRLDAELLLGEVMGLDRVGLYLNYDRPLLPDEREKYRKLVARRAEREPLQYILGRAEFWSLPFRVSPAVLIPRPETEILVEEGIKKVKPGDRVLDLGTGSGAIAVAFAHECPDISVTAIDVSAEALSVAEGNARSNSVDSRIRFLQASFTDPFPGSFELILSNPPYVSGREYEACMPEVKDYEPRQALVGGEDGLDCIRVIIKNAAAALKTGGWLMLEVGAGQAEMVVSLLEKQSFTETFKRQDYAGIFRVVGGQMPAV